MISLMDANCKVMAGISTFRRPWRRTMDVSDSPLALANSTKSLSMMLTIFSLVWRATEEIPVRLKAAAGQDRMADPVSEGDFLRRYADGDA